MKDPKIGKDRAAILREFDAAPDTALFAQNVVAAVRDCSEATLERDRWAGGGIPYRKIGRAVRYCKRDVVAWLDSYATLTSTSVQGG